MYSLVFILGYSFFQSLLAQNYPIVFVSRNLLQGGSAFYPQQGLLPGMGPFSRFKVTGGRLLVREASGTIRVLVDSTMNFGSLHIIDVSDPCVYWDGSKIVFSGIENRDSSWRIYEIRSDGTGFRKVTFTNRNISLAQFGTAAYKFTGYDDIDPCYLPDGRICFASTRYPSLSQIDGARTTNLYVIDTTSANLHRITTERNGAEEPSIDPITGRVVFSRWWLNIDRPSNLTYNGLTRDSGLALTNDMANLWEASSIRPDGEGVILLAGTGSFRGGLHNYKPVVLGDGRVIGTFVPYTAMTQTSGSTGIRWFNAGNSYPNHIAGVNMNTMQLYIQNPPSYGTMQPPYAVDPVELPDGRILFSFAAQVENADYALYTINLNGTNLQPYYDIPGKLELNADLLMPRTRPPILADLFTTPTDDLPPTADPGSWYKNGGFRFDCLNFFTNGPIDDPMQDAPPITKNPKIQFFLNFQRLDSLGKDTVLHLLTEPTFYSGQISLDFAPAEVPMFEQIIDTTGKVLRGANGQIAHVSGLNYGRQGVGTKCVGCHAGHTRIFVPANITEGQFFNTSTSAQVTQSSFKYVNDSLQFPGIKVVDRKVINDTLTVNWIANGTTDEYVNLKWDLPLDIRWIKLYNVKSNPANNTNIQVTDCDVIFKYLSNEIYRIQSTGPISVSGTQFDIPNLPKFDEMRVIIKSFNGTVNGENHAALAEIETNARISFYEIIGIKQISGIADKFSLSQNYPNPFNPVTKIKFSLPNYSDGGAQLVKLCVFDVLGRQAAVLVNEYLLPGIYERSFNASSFASGIYFYRLTVGDEFNAVKKMVVLK
jgi:hypothetical protein